MAFHQPLVPVLPVAKELFSKTKWLALPKGPANEEGAQTHHVAGGTKLLSSHASEQSVSSEQASVSDTNLIRSPSPIRGWKKTSARKLNSPSPLVSGVPFTDEPESMIAEGRPSPPKSRNRMKSLFSRSSSRSNKSVSSTVSISNPLPLPWHLLCRSLSLRKGPLFSRSPHHWTSQCQIKEQLCSELLATYLCLYIRRMYINASHLLSMLSLIYLFDVDHPCNVPPHLPVYRIAVFALSKHHDRGIYSFQQDCCPLEPLWPPPSTLFFLTKSTMPSVRIRRSKYATLDDAGRVERPQEPRKRSSLFNLWTAQQAQPTPVDEAQPGPSRRPRSAGSPYNAADSGNGTAPPKLRARAGSKVFDHIVTSRRPPSPGPSDRRSASADSQRRQTDPEQGFITLEGPNTDVRVRNTGEPSMVGSVLSLSDLRGGPQSITSIDARADDHHHDHIVEHLDVIGMSSDNSHNHSRTEFCHQRSPSGHCF
jgi:hypothetical protein